MSPATEVLTHVAGLQAKALDADVSVGKALEVLRQGLGELPDGDRWLDLVQHLQNALSTKNAHTDEALRVFRAAVAAGIDSGTVSAPAHTPQEWPKKFPSYMTELVVRGAQLLRLHGLGKVVSFDWWSDGEATAYTAHLAWRFDIGDEAPRLTVCRARSGDFVCQSLVGNFFEVDPSTWCTDVPSDEVDRELFEQAQRKAVGAAR